jgi:hypothetical protein
MNEERQSFVFKSRFCCFSLNSFVAGEDHRKKPTLPPMNRAYRFLFNDRYEMSHVNTLTFKYALRNKMRVVKAGIGRSLAHLDA